MLTYLRTSTHSRHISAISRLYLGYISHSRDRATREDSALAISLASSRLYLGYISAISRPYLELQRSRDAGRLGVGGFISEFGACGGSSTCLAELARVMDAADGAAEIQPRYSRDELSRVIDAADGTANDYRIYHLYSKWQCKHCMYKSHEVIHYFLTGAHLWGRIHSNVIRCIYRRAPLVGVLILM